MRINEIFPAIQGEGRLAGKPTVFVRFSGCNLKCNFCDSKYHTEGNAKNINDVVSTILSYDINSVTFTGGEPLLQEKNIGYIMNDLPITYSYHLETNGTIIPMLKYNSISCSPKKDNINNRVIQYMKNNDTSTLKFVYEDKNDTWWEQVIEDNSVPLHKVWIMPEGETRDKQLKLMSEVMDYCLESKLNFSPRTHVLGFDDMRAK